MYIYICIHMYIDMCMSRYKNWQTRQEQPLSRPATRALLQGSISSQNIGSRSVNKNSNFLGSILLKLHLEALYGNSIVIIVTSMFISCNFSCCHRDESDRSYDDDSYYYYWFFRHVESCLTKKGNPLAQTSSPRRRPKQLPRWPPRSL